MSKTFYTFVKLVNTVNVCNLKCLSFPKGNPIVATFKLIFTVLAQIVAILLELIQTNYTYNYSLFGSGQNDYEPKHNRDKIFQKAFYFFFCFSSGTCFYFLFSFGNH